LAHNNKKPALLKNQVRIIGGKWRSRKIFFPTLEGLRPTPDRIKETLFSWLSPDIVGANCLDLFAGSGVLGFEALSRGAKSLTWVDKDENIINSITENVQKLGAENCHIIKAKFPNLFIDNLGPYNIIFLDPPYSENLITSALIWLVTNHLLTKQAKIYIEKRRDNQTLIMPESLSIMRHKSTATIEYYLLTTY
jgi:16S rRNA (guanine966-N2)-methyltransferase